MAWHLIFPFSLFFSNGVPSTDGTAPQPLPADQRPVVMRMAEAETSDNPKDFTIENTTQACQVKSSEISKTELIETSDGLDSQGNEKIIQVLTVQSPEKCIFYFGRVKSTDPKDMHGKFYLLGEAVLDNGNIRVSYTPFGRNSDEIIEGLIEEIKSGGAQLPLDHLPVELDVSNSN